MPSARGPRSPRLKLKLRSMARVVWASAACLLLGLYAAQGQAGSRAERGPGFPERSEVWMDVILDGVKVGYAFQRIGLLEDGARIEERLTLALAPLGVPQRLEAENLSWVDERGRLRHFRFSLSSGVVPYKVWGRLQGRTLILGSESASGRVERHLTLKAVPVGEAALPLLFRGHPPRVGQELRLPLFDPVTLTQQEMRLRIAAREPLLLGGRIWEAYRAEAVVWGRPVTLWFDDQGWSLKQQGIMGLELSRTTREQAPRGIDAMGADPYQGAAVPFDAALPDPRRIRRLKLRVHGLAGSGFDPARLEGGRQVWQRGILEVVRETRPSKAGYTLPLSTAAAGAAARFLKPDFHVDSDHPLIQAEARQILAGTSDPLRVLQRALRRVQQGLRKRPLISVPRASEVLQSKVGDCNEHAVLLAAILRAAGIPARMAVGLAFGRGRFFYHAWNEAYVGHLPGAGDSVSRSGPTAALRTGWITLDATLGQMPVDATHITLIQGDLEAQMKIVPLIGRLRLELVDFETD